MAFALVVGDGPFAGRRYVFLERALELGRGAELDAALGWSSTVQLVQGVGGTLLKSRKAIAVNGTSRCEPVSLRAGDVLRDGTGRSVAILPFPSGPMAPHTEWRGTSPTATTVPSMLFSQEVGGPTEQMRGAAKDSARVEHVSGLTEPGLGAGLASCGPRTECDELSPGFMPSLARHGNIRPGSVTSRVVLRSPPTRGSNSTQLETRFARVVALTVLSGAVTAVLLALTVQARSGAGAPSEVSRLGTGPVERVYGEGEGLPAAPEFQFEVVGPGRVSAVLRLHASGSGVGQVSIVVNGRSVGRLVEHIAKGPEQVLSIESLQLKPGINTLRFERRLASHGPWKVWDVRVDLRPLPVLSGPHGFRRDAEGQGAVPSSAPHRPFSVSEGLPKLQRMRVVLGQVTRDFPAGDSGCQNLAPMKLNRSHRPHGFTS